MAPSPEVLHDLIERRQWKSACMHLQSNPSDASVSKSNTNGVDLYPLHRACEAHAPYVVIKALLTAYADAAKVKGEHGFLPLRYVCQKSSACDKVVSLLLGAYATAACVPDNKGMLPLHAACKFGASVEVIDIILAAHPEGMHVQDVSYNYPLDYVKSGSNKNKLSVFKALDHASVYCNISKAATTRTTEKFEAKIQKMETEHSSSIAKLKTLYEEEKEKARNFGDLLNKSDVQKERAKVEKLADEMELMKTSRDAERAKTQKDQEELQVHLEAARTNFKQVSAELGESKSKIEALLDVERSLKNKVTDLEGEIESTVLKLQETSIDRDDAKLRVETLEVSLSDANTQNAAFKKQNQMLKDMLRSMSENVHAMIAEHEKVKETLAARSLELHSIVTSHDALLERASSQKETLLHTKIDLDNIVRFVNMEEDVTSDGGLSADTESTSSSSAAEVPARIEVPLEEKALGSLVLKEVQ